jgi:hypothetical protein
MTDYAATEFLAAEFFIDWYLLFYATGKAITMFQNQWLDSKGKSHEFMRDCDILSSGMSCTYLTHQYTISKRR